jgi:hypothetical protein
MLFNLIAVLALCAISNAMPASLNNTREFDLEPRGHIPSRPTRCPTHDEAIAMSNYPTLHNIGLLYTGIDVNSGALGNIELRFHKVSIYLMYTKATIEEIHYICQGEGRDGFQILSEAFASVMSGEVDILKPTPGWGGGGRYFTMERDVLINKNRTYPGAISAIYRVDGWGQRLERLYLEYQ